MEAPNNALLDTEQLHHLTYERSKTWATFLSNVAEREDEAEISLDNLEKLCPAEVGQSDDELASMEDDADDNLTADAGDIGNMLELLRDITSRNHISLAINNRSGHQSDAKGPAKGVILTERGAELQDLFEQTLPIINEHERQWKAAGFDRVLNSFDAAEIEEKVGGWLRRNQSQNNCDSLVVHVPNDYEYQGACNKRGAMVRGRYNEDLDSGSEESMQSVDTARYIRSSRANAMRRSSSTTMIKTYRMVKSKRDALREKYSSGLDDDECYVKAIQSRRRMAADLKHPRGRYEPSAMRHKHHQMFIAPHEKMQRRKSRHKRRVSYTGNTTDSSSDTGHYVHPKSVPPLKCCSRRHRWSSTKSQRKFQIISKRTCHHNRSDSKCSSFCASSSSFTKVYREGRSTRRRDVEIDGRPCKRESECRCCNDAMLCRKYKHLADTSTEDWYVDNCFSAKKSSQGALSVISKYPTARLEAPLKLPKRRSLSISGALNKEKAPLNQKQVKKKLTSKVDNRKSTQTVKVTKSPPEPKKNSKVNVIKEDEAIVAKTGKNLKMKNGKNLNVDEDVSFDTELEMALKASLKLFEEEQRRKQSSDLKEKSISLPVEPKLFMNCQNPKKKKKNESRKREAAKSAKTTLSKAKLARLDNSLREDDNHTDDETKNLKSDVKLKALKRTKQTSRQYLSPLHGMGDSLFAPKPNICNSTAMSSDATACSRQFGHLVEKSNAAKSMERNVDKKAKMKGRSPAVSSSSIVIFLNDDVSKNSPSNAEKCDTEYSKDNGENDCTVVTSTTGGELQTEPEKPQQLGRSKSKGIIIYTPHDRTVLSQASHNNNTESYFNISKEHLSAIIGEHAAAKFLKYYVGRRRFNSNSTVYYRPPSTVMVSGSEESSDSDDVLDHIDKYGELYESVENNQS